MSKRPVDCVLVVFYPELSSPAELLSAVLPPKLAGVDKVLVSNCTEGFGSWPDSLLLALELAGIDEVYVFSSEQVESLCKDTTSRGFSTKLVCVNDVNNFPFSSIYNFAPLVDTISLYPPKKCGIWLDEQVIPDVDALKFAHPDLYFQVWASDSKPLNSFFEGYKKQKGTWEEFCQTDFDLVFAPSHFHMQLVNRFPVVLGPGQECFWIWPDLILQRFQTSRVAFSFNN